MPDTFDQELTTAEIDEIDDELEAEGITGVDPVKVVIAVIRYMRKKWDEKNNG